MIEGIDSHYEAVKARILAVNPNRQLGGVMESQNWPPENVQFDTFYMLNLGLTPTEGTASAPIVSHVIQWVWINQGTDLQLGLKGKNRGDRYRTAFQMKEEMLQGLYPYLTQKLSWSLDSNNVLQSTPVVPTEYVTWSRPTMMARTDQKSGHVYVSATIHLVNITDQITS